MSYELMTSAEAKKTIWNAKGRQCYIQVDVPLPCAPGRVFPGMTNVPVSRRVAMDMVDRLLSNFEDRGALIRVEILEHCLFIGATTMKINIQNNCLRCRENNL